MLLPALEAALQRRAIHLQANIRKLASQNPNSASVQIQQKEKQQAHDRVKRLCIKAAAIFKEIEEWDNRSPVGMGGEINGFLEGFLEECLVRVDAEDYDDDAGPSANVSVGAMPIPPQINHAGHGGQHHGGYPHQQHHGQRSHGHRA